jgi:nucleotide-binding universal stress UspA family protein
MPIAFNKILIPVDFSLNTDIAVKRAAALAGADTVLYLLHIIPPGKSAAHHFKMWAAEKELDQWKNAIRGSNPALRVKTHLFKGHSVQQLIIDCAAMLNPDLVVIGKQHGRRGWLDRWVMMRGRWRFSSGVSPDVIARKSNCPVLTVKPGSIDSRNKVIVIPIRDFLPERKLEWAVLLARKFKAQVHLLAIQENPEPKEWALPQVFLKAYHHLRENLHIPIEYSSTGRHNPAMAALKYAEMIMADMILVNPETESGVSGITGSRHISDLLGRDSKIQVLDVEPYKTEEHN